MINWDEQTLRVVPRRYLETWISKQKETAMKSFSTETEEERRDSLNQITFDDNSIDGGEGRNKEYFLGEDGISFVNLN